MPDDEGRVGKPAKPGLYRKYWVSRTDGRDRPGAKHQDCPYFVLDLVHDPHAVAALRAYAESCRRDEPHLASELVHVAMLMEGVHEGYAEPAHVHEAFGQSVHANHTLVKAHPNEYEDHVVASVVEAAE